MCALNIFIRSHAKERDSFLNLPFIHKMYGGFLTFPLHFFL